jgi:hypothetical protein
MAIFAYVVGLSMGNTCQELVFIPKTNGCICSHGEISRKRQILLALVWDLRHSSFPRFSTVLHNPPPLSTGSAQPETGFVLRRRRLRVQS